MTKNRWKRAAALLLTAAMLLTTAVSCRITGADDETDDGIVYTPLDTTNMQTYEESYVNDSASSPLDYDGYISRYKSDKYELLYHPKDCSIIVRDLASGYMWTSSVDLQQKPLERVEELWRKKLSSVITIDVIDTNHNQGIATTIYPHDGAKFSVTEIEGGIEVTFAFEAQYIQLSLRIYMKDDELHAEIPGDSIFEQGNYMLVSADVLPMFGCVETNKEDGYVFYPDGSGALSYFTVENVREQEARYMWKVYGETPGEMQWIGESRERMDYDSILDNDDDNVTPASMPVYGIREDDSHALLAIISSGSADAIINYVPGGYVVELNRLYTTFTYRRPVDLSEIGGTGVGNADRDVTRFEAELQRKDAAMTYKFLLQGQADYSGMAAAYREYLIQNDLLKDYIQDDNMMAGIDLFMGIYEERALGDKFMAQTTFEEAQQILGEIREQTGVGIQTALYGWQKEGYDRNPTSAKAASQLGGNSGLEELAEFANQNGITLTLNVNPVTLNGERSGYTARTDAAYTSSGLPLYSRKYNEYVRNLNSMFNDYLPDFVDYAKSMGIGLNIERLGWWLYNDYSEHSFYTRTQAYDFIQQKLGEIRSEGMNYWSEANLYAMSNASRIVNLSYEHSQYDISNESIPFYQMVVHSYLPYTSYPGNLAHDLNWIELKWAEYGYMPYFMLTEENAENLKYTDANWLYSSVYSQWGPRAVEVINRMKERLSCVWNSEMVRHEKLNSQEVYRIEYANGKVVYVNYTSSDYVYGDVTIPATDYVVV